MGMAVLWATLALEPVAVSRVQADAQPGYVVPGAEQSGSNPVARGVIAFADKVRGSALGGTAEATNPMSGARLLTLSNDFVAVAQDEEAFDYLMKTPVMQEIAELPSVKTAVERVKADSALQAMFNDKGVDHADAAGGAREQDGPRYLRPHDRRARPFAADGGDGPGHCRGEGEDREPAGNSAASQAAEQVAPGDGAGKWAAARRWSCHPARCSRHRGCSAARAGSSPWPIARGPWPAPLRRDRHRHARAPRPQLALAVGPAGKVRDGLAVVPPSKVLWYPARVTRERKGAARGGWRGSCPPRGRAGGR